MSLPIDQQIVHAWEIHNRITVELIGQIPEGGFEAVPLNSRGRTVARQLAHMNAVRTGWLHYHQTGKHPRRPDRDKAAEPTREQLRLAFVESGEAVAGFLREALAGGKKVQMFGGEAVRWFAYLVAHESHHRGSIALALKQARLRLPEKVALQGMWGRWISGS